MRSASAITRDYEHWLAERIVVVPADVARKHAEMRVDRFRFLRGTYYLWLARVVSETPDVLDTARVPLVGDLHIENFGTWRDRKDVRRWGVNDLDELARGPWLLDLLRLAVSATLAPHIALDDEEVCELLLREYAAARPGRDVALSSGKAEHLRALVPPFASRAKFYAALEGGHAVDDVPPDVVAGALSMTGPGWQPTWHVREAGMGSLGHRRRVGVGTAADGRSHAREAKELGPGTAVWAAPLDPRLPQRADDLYGAVLRAVEGPGAAARVDGWQVRDLAPDVVRIELAGLRRKGARRLLKSMARATADVHHTEPDAWRLARREARSWQPRELHDLVRTMVEVVKADFKQYGGPRP